MQRMTSFLGTLAVAGAAIGCGEDAVLPTESAATESFGAEPFAHVPAHAAAGSRFLAPLSAAAEIPEPDLTATMNPRGMTTLLHDAEAAELHFRLIVANIENVIQAHIHCGPADGTGPVVAFLFGLVESGVSVSGILAEGTVTNADVIARPDSGVCPGGVANLDELLAHMRDGNAYVNVHTLQNPAGEIRGQIRTVGSP